MAFSPDPSDVLSFMLVYFMTMLFGPLLTLLSQFITDKIHIPETSVRLPRLLDPTAFQSHYSCYPFVSRKKADDVEAQYQNTELLYCRDYLDYLDWHRDYVKRHYAYLDRRLSVYGGVGLLCCVCGGIMAYVLHDTLRGFASAAVLLVKGMVARRLGHCVSP